MARPRKPASQRTGRRKYNDDRSRLTLVRRERDPDEIRGPPLRPDGQRLCARALGAWDSYWRSPLPDALESVEVDAIGVERWVQLIDWVAELEAAIQEEPAVDGSSANKVLSPYNRLRKECVAEIRYYEETLGLTIAARKKLAITIVDDVPTDGGFSDISDYLRKRR